MQQFFNAPEDEKDKALRELIHESNKEYEKLIDKAITVSESRFSETGVQYEAKEWEKEHYKIL